LDERADRLPHRRRCPSCLVATTTPWPSAEDLQAAYGTWYRPGSGRFSGVGDKLFRLLRGGFSRHLLSIAPDGPILDVGAGDGSLIDSVRAKGREAVGLDPYSDRADFITQPIEELGDGWAAIVFWHSLEHVPNPTHHLEHAARALMPGGVLVIAVPNPSSVQARLFGGRWLHLDYPRHLVHIPPEALTTEVTRLGLRVDRLSYYRGGNVVFGWLHGLVGTVGGDLDLYDAIRKPEARSRPMTGSKRLITVALGVILLPIALVASAVEVAMRRGGTIYVEASKP
jgi:SAM-dependent methyltransferase